MGAPTAIEDGIVTRLATISTLQGRAHDTRPSPVPPLAAWPELVDDEGFVTFGDDAVYSYDLYLVVPSQKGAKSADQVLKPYLAHTTAQHAQSVRGALLGDGTLGGAADGIRNIRLSQRGSIEIGDVQRYGAIWRLEVMAQ